MRIRVAVPVLFPFIMKNKRYKITFFLFLFLGGVIISKTLVFSDCLSCCKYAPELTNLYIFLWGTAQIDGNNVDIGDEIRGYRKSEDKNCGCVGFFEVIKTGYYGAMAVYEDESIINTTINTDEKYKIYFTICHNRIEYLCKEESSWDIFNINKTRILNLTTDFDSELTFNDKGCPILPDDKHVVSGEKSGGGGGCFISLISRKTVLFFQSIIEYIRQ